MTPAEAVACILKPQLSVLAAVDPGAAKRRKDALSKDLLGTMRGTPLISAMWCSLYAPGGPWVWAVGDAHPGNFATLATGLPDRDGVVPITYGIADVDDEGPAPWSWDLLRLLSGVALASGVSGKVFKGLADLTRGTYAETAGRLAEGDDLASRIDWTGLPDALRRLIEDGHAEGGHKRHIATVASGQGKAARLLRTEDVADDPAMAAALAEVVPALDWPRGGVLVDVARRLRPRGVSSSGRRRWYLLVREAGPPARLRLMEAKERGPAVVARLSPYPPWSALPGLPVTVTMGGDPFQRVVRSPMAELLLRTRCHCRETLDLATLDQGDRERLAHLYGQLLADFHHRGLSCLLGVDPGRVALRQAGQAAAQADSLAEQARDLAEFLVGVHAVLIR